MKISLHSGNCCGIKTISHFEPDPDEWLESKEQTTKGSLSDDRDGSEFESSFNFYWKPRPKEAGKDRFKAYIEYLEAVRKYGLVEVAITIPCITGEQLMGDTMDSLELGVYTTFDEAVSAAAVAFEDDDDDGWVDADYEEGGYPASYTQEDWVPVFESYGFKLVSEFPNINSGNTVRVYHLVMNGEYYKNKEKK